jgi:uncharacterized protein YwgA
MLMGVTELSSFLTMLQEKINFNFNVNEFGDRLKTQKYVFLSQFFGWEHGYSYNLYIRGPYSKELADDYYRVETEYEIVPFPEIAPAFYENSFIALVKDKGEEWLESATTLMSIYRYNVKPSLEREAAAFALMRTKELKSNIHPQIIHKAYQDLAHISLLPSYI